VTPRGEEVFATDETARDVGIHPLLSFARDPRNPQHAVQACEEGSPISWACGDDAGLSDALPYLGFISSAGEPVRARSLLENRSAGTRGA
jgi:hypothetical protein